MCVCVCVHVSAYECRHGCVGVGVVLECAGGNSLTVSYTLHI